MIVVFFLLVVLFLFHSKNLLLSLLLLELLSFLVLFLSSYYLSPSLISDFLLLALFAVFVMEGVIALSGLITLVTFTGSDYVRSSSFMKL